MHAMCTNPRTTKITLDGILRGKITIMLKINKFSKIMALTVMEFQDQGYKIRKVFAKKSTYPMEIIKICELD